MSDARLIAPLLAGGLFLFAASPASACYSVIFNNNSEKDITVVWTATGCAGVNNWVTYACTHKSIKSGASASYSYNWGVTFPAVMPVLYKIEGFDDADNAMKYKYGGGHFSVDNGADSPSGCGGHYTINFSEDDRKKFIQKKGS